MKILLRDLTRWIAVATGALALAACSTAGHNFNETALGALTPGQTTLFDAKIALGAQPADVYAQGDGTSLVRWAYKATILTDGLYHRKEATLLFGPDGRLIRLVSTDNVLLEPWQREKLIGTGAYN